MQGPLFRDFGEIVAPSHTCLVVWDVQNGLVRSIPNREEFLRNLGNLMGRAREAGLPVVYTRIASLPTPYEAAFRVYMMMKGHGVDDPDKLPPFMQPGSEEAQIEASLAPKEGDPVLDKHTASIFIGTHFEYMMRNRGITTILFTGLSTERGVASSARDAVNRGFYTVVVSDCVSSPARDMHEMTLKILERVCLVAPAAQIMAGWK